MHGNSNIKIIIYYRLVMHGNSNIKIIIYYRLVMHGNSKIKIIIYYRLVMRGNSNIKIIIYYRLVMHGNSNIKSNLTFLTPTSFPHPASSPCYMLQLLLHNTAQPFQVNFIFNKESCFYRSLGRSLCGTPPRLTSNATLHKEKHKRSASYSKSRHL